ncbi:MAG: hypothetical protein HY791_29755 [Deltaproteobacteria bacterium]|nr:hypothetical protein [Deltaproteobacteria bacterium]
MGAWPHGAVDPPGLTERSESGAFELVLLPSAPETITLLGFTRAQVDGLSCARNREDIRSVGLRTPEAGDPVLPPPAYSASIRPMIGKAELVPANRLEVSAEWLCARPRPCPSAKLSFVQLPSDSNVLFAAPVSEGILVGLESGEIFQVTPERYERVARGPDNLWREAVPARRGGLWLGGLAGEIRRVETSTAIHTLEVLHTSSRQDIALLFESRSGRLHSVGNRGAVERLEASGWRVLYESQGFVPALSRPFVAMTESIAGVLLAIEQEHAMLRIDDDGTIARLPDPKLIQGAMTLTYVQGLGPVTSTGALGELVFLDELGAVTDMIATGVQRRIEGLAADRDGFAFGAFPSLVGRYSAAQRALEPGSLGLCPELSVYGGNAASARHFIRQGPHLYVVPHLQGSDTDSLPVSILTD